MSAAAALQGAQLSCIALEVAVADRILVSNLTVRFPNAAMTAILGRNGAGKTLTLHTLTGLRAPARGDVQLDDRSLAVWPRRTRARAVGLLTQTTEDAFPSTALDATLVGRHPHIGFWDWEGEDDRRYALEALAAVQLKSFEAREVATLSGGERRRVAFAALLTQNPDVYLLDEPTNHLDPHHQIDVLTLLREKAQAGQTIVMTLHDAALAARFSDYALLLFGDGEWLYGATDEVLNEETMSRLYGLRVREVTWDGGRTFVMG
jgi:iron complex transport system ATP-binding protein